MRPLSLVLLVACLAVAGCGSGSSSTNSANGEGTAKVATTTGGGAGAADAAKFALHAGIAFGAFHRYIYKPLRTGELRSPLSHKLAVLKAAAAAAVAVHEIKLAEEAAKGSPGLAKLAASLSALSAGIGLAIASARSGRVNPTALEAGNSTVESISSDASSEGISILQRAPSLP
ncbi:MAG: hypothetical protein ACLQMH_01475 [Solirubrobacteraceae bacterium]